MVPAWSLVVFATVVGALTEPLIPALMKPLLDRGFQGGDLAIWTVPAALMLLFGVRGFAGYLAQIGLAKITNQGLSLMRRAMFKKILTADLGLFSSQSSSALSNTVVFEAQTGATILVNSFLSLSRNGLTVIALTAYLLYLNWQLSIIVTIVFPAVAMVMRALTRRVHGLTIATQHATDQLAYVVEENILAHRDIRLYAAQTAQAGRFDQLSESLRRLAMKTTVAGAAMTPVTQMLAAAALSAVISIAMVQSAGNNTSVGGFAAFVTAMLMIIAPVRQLSELSNSITRGLAAIERGLLLMETTPDEDSGTFSKERAVGEIEFTDVSVRYSEQSPLSVDKVSFSIRPGETVALVGASGAGKSTIANLLPRFTEIHTGAVTLDGHDIRTWGIESLRAQLAVVSQNPILINDTIAANVALGLELDRSQVLACLESAHLFRWISDLPNGIDTLVGHNAIQLSGGQRQRLAIARALYKNAPVLLLDEATSALDSESEKAVQAALQILMAHRTVLVIAHRLSTIMHASKIIVMDAGKVVEMGTHQDLIAAGGTYARLYQLGFNDKPAADTTQQH
jgi:subfamily B ATP-binding cassette protein MsbA